MNRSASLAKISRPSPVGVLARERLFKMIDRRRRAPVVWIHGPPGSGKTTLLSSYLESRASDARWYQLDSGDSDVATFFYYMGLAAGEEKGPGLPLFTSEYHGDLAAFTRRYFQALFARLEAPFVVVLDDYQEIATHSAFHEVLLGAAAEVPAEGCLVVLSRTEPPAPLARLRANREVEVLGWKELRLTRREADQLMVRWHPDLTEHARETLYERTEGWAAGLVLMLEQAETLGIGGEAADLSAPQAVFDYLAGEIFDSFEDSTRTLLLRTAFLPQMTPATAESLSGEPRAGEILADLHRDHHFLTLIPGRAGPIFQHHPLLRAFLRRRASETLGRRELAALRRATSERLEAEGAIEDAVALLREERDWNGLARVVLTHAPDMLRLGRAETLEHWLEALPEEVLDADPWFTYWRASCRVQCAPREARLLWEHAHAQFARASEPDRKGLVLACSGAMEAIIYELDDLTLLDRWIPELERLMPDPDAIEWPYVRARAIVSMFMALVFRQPQHPRIADWAERAFAAAGSLPDTNARLAAQLLIAINLNYTGQFARVRDLVAAMRRACESPHVPPVEITVLEDVESMHAMLNADADACRRAVDEGLEVARTSGVHLWSYHLLSNGVAGALGAGDLDAAEDLIGQMRDWSHGARRLDLCQYHYYSAWHAMLTGDVLRAHQETRTALKLATETGCPFYEVLCRLALAQVLVECGEQARAVSQLRRVRRAARDIDNRLLEFQCLAVYADIAIRYGRERSGVNALAYAMRLGREHGFRHFLWWLPETMARLAERALLEGIETEYVVRLIRERGLEPTDPRATSGAWPWAFRVSTFGGFRIEKDGKPLGMMAKVQHKPLELLRVLVGYGGDAVPEMRVATTLYPRIDGDYAHRSLTTALHRLRKLLGEDRVVLLRHGRLTVNPEVCWLDLYAFEHASADVEAWRRSPERERSPAAAHALAERLLDLYRGPFMHGETERAHYVSLREKARSRFARCIGDLAHGFEEAGDQDAAIDLYRRALEADALAEGFYRRLMLCYRELGRQAEAVEVYDACRRTFRAELEVDPSPETTAIYRALLGEL